MLKSQTRLLTDVPPQVTITIEAPNGKSDEFPFDQSTKVSDAAEKAANEFGIQNTNNPTLFHKPGSLTKVRKNSSRTGRW